MRMTFLVALTLFLSACADFEVQPYPGEGASVTVRNDDDENAKRVKAQDQYEGFIKTYKCDPSNWERYELSAAFQKLATIYKISPFDVADGSAYKRRKISPELQTQIDRNYYNYRNNAIPWQVMDKFYENFPTTEEEKLNQKTIFNDLIKRDYECYKKLK